jgi:hypothetical protein
MSAVSFVARSDLRRKWRTRLVLALVVGVVGGVVLTAAAGAMRTESAFPRLLRAVHGANVLVSPNGTGLTGYYNALARLPQVTSTASVLEFNVGIPASGAPPDAKVQAEASPGDVYGVSMDRVKILRGRMFNPRDQHAAMVDAALAQREHLEPGGTLHLAGIPNDAQGIPDLNHSIPMSFRVSAIVLFDNQVVPANQFNAYPMALLSPAFLTTKMAKAFPGADGAEFRLRPGASKAAFIHEANALVSRFPDVGGQVFVADLAVQAAVTERAIRPEAVALGMFAALVALIGLAIVAQLLSRQIFLDTLEYPNLRAMGMDVGQLTTLSLLGVGVVTLAGSLVAVGVSIAASPIMPIGPARVAEPSPGVEVSLGVVAIGLFAVAALPVLVVVPAARRAARRHRGLVAAALAGAAGRRSRFGSALGAASGSVTATLGLQMAFDPGRGRTAVPARSTLVGTIVALVAVVAALVFGASLNRLVGTPHLYGQNWDRQLDLGFGAAPASVLQPVVAAQRAVAADAAGDYGQVSIHGTTVAAIGLDDLRGGGFVTLLGGRPPSTPDEIALGARTLQATHLGLGQRVPVTIQGRTRVMRIVGEAVLASFSQGSFTATDLGSGALVAASVFSSAPGNGCSGSATCYNFVLVRYRPGTNLGASAAHLTAVATAAGCPAPYCPAVANQRPKDIEDYTRIRNTPAVLATLLAVLGVATLAYALVTSVHRRRRELAVLKTLGLRRPQVLAVVAWQASALTMIALVVGLPLGLVAGHWAWAAFADTVGVSSDASIPWLWVGLAVPIAVVLANLIALVPGWVAGRTKPAVVLRSE